MKEREHNLQLKPLGDYGLKHPRHCCRVEFHMMMIQGEASLVPVMGDAQNSRNRGECRGDRTPLPLHRAVYESWNKYCYVDQR